MKRSPIKRSRPKTTKIRQSARGESIDSLSPYAEILYYRILVTVDDFGRYDARPSMVKAACFPIKDTITATKTETLMRELVEHGLVVVYEVEGKPYLQMCKWDNVPRAKESKYPAHEHDCTHMYTDVCNTHTDAPLTVTKTETETKTKTETVVSPVGVSESVWQDFAMLHALCLRRVRLLNT